MQPPHPNHSWLFDEGTGTVAASYSNQSPATFLTGADWSGNVPFAYPNNHSINVAGGGLQTPGFPLGSSGTISLWAHSLWEQYPTSTGRSQYLYDSSGSRTLLYLNIKEDPDPKKNIEVTWINNTGTGGQGDWANTQNFLTDQWYHIAIVWDNADGTPIRVYKNDDLVASTTQSVPISSLPNTWFLGRKYNNADERWHGEIDEFAYWDHALSLQEVQWLSHNSISGLPEPGSLLLAILGLLGVMTFGLYRRS